MRHITSEKGDIGELKVSADLIAKGYSVFTPISSTSPFDLLVYVNNKYLRVQVKYRTISPIGVITAVLARHSISYSKITAVPNTYVDLLAIYCPDTDKCYYVYTNEIEGSITLRFMKPKNNQSKGLRFAEDYTKLKSIK